MKRQTFVLVALAVASAAAFCVVCAPAVEAGRAALRLVTREVALGRVQAGELKRTRTVSRNRRHVAFVAKVAGGEAAYLDGVAGKTYPAVASDPLSEAGTGSPFTFSPDGKRMYFRLRKNEGGKETVVVDGRAYAYDEIKDVEFSPDGRRLVFKAQRGRGWVMVLDGAESEVYEPDGGAGGAVAWSRDGRLAFSKEGGRMAYVGRKGGKEFVVLDGAAGASYDAVANLDFTPDGRHVVHTARRAGKSVVVVDGVESRAYDAFVPAREHEREGSLNVEGAAALSILARRGPELLRVEIEIVP